MSEINTEKEITVADGLGNATPDMVLAGATFTSEEGFNQTGTLSLDDPVLEEHIANTQNPHAVTKSQVGLGNVDNTSDTDKPVSTAQQEAINEVQNNLDSHTSDTENPHKVTKSQVGLGNVDNTADSAKPVSTAQKAAIDAVQTNLNTHTANTSNPHEVTKEQVGLGNVENKSSATIRSEITSANVTAALGYTPLNPAVKGAANGVAELDANGIILTSQLPSFVDDVLEYSSKSSFPTTGETGKIYVDTSNNKTYRWSGSAYVEISASLALGETSSTAYRGDRGKAAYDHSQAAHARTDATKVADSTTNGNILINGVETNVYTHPGSGTNPHGTTKSDVGLGNVPNVTTNNQTPTYTAATTLAALTSGEVLSTAFGKIAKAVADLITHLKNTSNPHSVTKTQVGLGNVPNVATNNQTPTFTVASTRANIASGETLTVILGKIMKFFADLKTVAFTGSYTDLSNKPTIKSNIKGTQVKYQYLPTAKTAYTVNLGSYNFYVLTVNVGGIFRNSIVMPSALIADPSIVHQVDYHVSGTPHWAAFQYKDASTIYLWTDDATNSPIMYIYGYNLA